MIRIGHGYDVHRLAQDRKLILGGVLIPNDLGLLGHSDADVLVHAIIDALLGALALGDIGGHFPDKSLEYKDIDSRLLLRKSYELIRAQDYKLGNLDSVICAQAPRLAPYILQMRENIAHDLNCSTTQISIKATTEEGLGISGSQMGITASATLLLFKDNI